MAGVYKIEVSESEAELKELQVGMIR